MCVCVGRCVGVGVGGWCVGGCEMTAGVLW